MSTLFPLNELGPLAETAGPIAVVAIEHSIDRVLDYSIPPRLVPLLRIGQRVRVPLGRGNKPVSGYVVDLRDTTAYPKVKPVRDLVDDRVLVAPPMMQLARWIARYYVTPLGRVFESVIPAAVKKLIGIGHRSIVSLAVSREDLQAAFEKTKAPKRRAIIARLLQLASDETIELVRLAGEAEVKPATVRKLLALKLIHIVQQPDTGPLPVENTDDQVHETDRPLNEDQQRAFDQLRPRVQAGGFSVNLLHGVTGSGKTEVYLQCIRQVVAGGKQAIVLVPEIALTPQTVRRFVARFPRVAILHSGLTATQRHRYWQRIASGEADVIVGARSAVFAPTSRLGIIVVDEEHDSSYKQDTAPRYQGRDVAIKRAQLENVPVLLGSATPSLETWLRVNAPGKITGAIAADPGVITGDALPAAVDLKPADRSEAAEAPTLKPVGYHLITLPNRVMGLQLPHIEMVDMRQQARLRRGVHLISARLEHLLGATIQKGNQAILLLNRRGYSNYVYCASCGEALQCKFCDATMTYHRTAGAAVLTARTEAGVHTGQLTCHYCLASNPLPSVCPTCGKKLSLFGLGTQRVEEELVKKFPQLKYARVDSDTMRNSRDYEALLGRFASGEIQVMLGTQMIAKGLDYPNVTLVGVISGDTALALPDFRAGERTFQLITQVAGRAGRGEAPGRVILQTFMPDDPTIRFAMKQDYLGFAANELKMRQEVGLPPYTRMVRIILRDTEPEKLLEMSELLAGVITTTATAQGGLVKIKGPMPCPINRIAGYYRNQIVLVSDNGKHLQTLLREVRRQKGFSKSDRVAVDVDPTSLL